MNLLTQFLFIVTGYVQDALSTDLQITDETDYTTFGIDTPDVDAVFKITDPDGDVIYENTDFNASDIDFDLGNVFSFGSLPESVSGNALFGDYVIEQQTRIYGVTSEGIQVINVADDPAAIVILGFYDIDEGQDLTWTNAVNGGTFPILSVTYDGENTTIVLDRPALTPNLNPLGTVVFTYTQLVTETFVIEFNTGLPSLSFDVDVNCDYGTLEVTDNSIFDGVLSSSVREFTVKYPDNVDVEIPDVVFSTAQRKFTDLMAGGTYNIELERTIVFETSPISGVQFLLKKAKDVPVDCSDSLCCIVECYKSFQDNLSELEASGDTRKFQAASNKLSLITSKIVAANLIRSCALSGYSELVNSVKTMLEQEECSCGCSEEQNAGFAYRVTPIAEILGGALDLAFTSTEGTITITPSVSGSTTTYNFEVAAALIASLQGTDGSTIFTGEGTPSPLLGRENDLYIRTGAGSTQGYLYKKTATQWVFVISLKGTDGAPGAPGADGVQIFIQESPPTIPGDDDIGNEDDVWFATRDRFRGIYKKGAVSWALESDLALFDKPVQDNADQNPLVANSSISNPFNYIERRNVSFRTLVGNNYTANYLRKVDEDFKLTTIFGNETVRIQNIGEEPITFDGSGFETYGGGLGIGYLKTIDGQNIDLPAGGIMELVFIRSAGSPFDQRFMIVSKNF